VEACPICRRPSVFASPEEARRVRPFCSARCKLIDLGNWASEDYRVASNERVQDLGEASGESNGNEEEA